MKVGILTFHCAHNYGAVLQCYSLQETLKELGHDVEVIDYRPKYITDCYRPIPRYRLCFRKPLLLIKHILYEVLYVIPRWSSFELFIKRYLCISKTLKINCDYIVIGSDQLWNRSITGGEFDPTYFGSGIIPDKTNVIFYGVSKGASAIKPEEKIKIAEALKGHHSISVREKPLADNLRVLLGKEDIFTALDPVLLHDKNFWGKFAKKPKISEKYILIYEVQNSTRTEEIAKELSKRSGAEIIRIAANVYHESNNFGAKIVVSPQEFVGWFMSADYVLTTSFHGTVFSLLFNKKFSVIEINGSGSERSKVLLEGYGRAHNFLRLSDKFEYDTQYCDSKNVNDIFCKSRQESLDFLKKSLSQ